MPKGYFEYQISNVKQLLINCLRESLQGRPSQRLEPDEVKISSPVLRGLRVGNSLGYPTKINNLKFNLTFDNEYNN